MAVFGSCGALRDSTHREIFFRLTYQINVDVKVKMPPVNTKPGIKSELGCSTKRAVTATYRSELVYSQSNPRIGSKRSAGEIVFSVERKGEAKRRRRRRLRGIGGSQDGLDTIEGHTMKSSFKALGGPDRLHAQTHRNSLGDPVCRLNRASPSTSTIG